MGLLNLIGLLRLYKGVGNFGLVETRGDGMLRSCASPLFRASAKTSQLVEPRRFWHNVCSEGCRENKGAKVFFIDQLYSDALRLVKIS